MEKFCNMFIYSKKSENVSASMRQLPNNENIRKEIKICFFSMFFHLFNCGNIISQQWRCSSTLKATNNVIIIQLTPNQITWNWQFIGGINWTPTWFKLFFTTCLNFVWKPLSMLDKINSPYKCIVKHYSANLEIQNT